MRYFLINFKHILTIASLSDPYLWPPVTFYWIINFIDITYAFYMFKYIIINYRIFIHISSLYSHCTGWVHHTLSILAFMIEPTFFYIVFNVETVHWCSFPGLSYYFISPHVKLSVILMHLHRPSQDDNRVDTRLCDII